jgi:hypothetical protein
VNDPDAAIASLIGDAGIGAEDVDRPEMILCLSQAKRDRRLIRDFAFKQRTLQAEQQRPTV